MVELWSGSTIHTVGIDGPPLTGPYVVHHEAEPWRLELLTLDRPKNTVVIPWPCPSALSPVAPS